MRNLPGGEGDLKLVNIAGRRGRTKVKKKNEVIKRGGGRKKW